MIKLENILVLAPHADDGELGAGGFISKLIEEGARVTYVAYSICEESIPDTYPRDVLAHEVKAATEVLGIDEKRVLLRYFPVRNFTTYRQDILEDMVKLRREIRPDAVLLPAVEDVHQDHTVIYQEGLRAFKNTTLIGYEMPWNNFGFNGNLLVKLEQKHLKCKLNAYSKYKSQGFRSYSADKLESLAKVRGLQAGCEFAEAFHVTRWVLS